MPSYLTIAYAIFIAVPLLLALSIHLRRRRVERALGEREEGAAPSEAAGGKFGS